MEINLYPIHVFVFIREKEKVMKKKKNLFKVLSEADMKIKLKSAAEEHSEAHIWEQSNNTRELFYITEFQEDQNRFILRPSLNETTLIEKECLINFETDDREYFSTGTIQPSEKGLFLFSLGDKVFRFDKRKHLRIPGEFTEGLTFKVNRQKDFHFQCINISEGGIGIICTPDKKDVFAINKKFRDVFLEFNGKNYPIELVIVQYNGEADEEYSNKLQIGLSFKGITETVKFNIKKEVQKCLFKALKSKKAS